MGYIILLWHSLSLPYNYFSDQCLFFLRYKQTKIALTKMKRLLQCCGSVAATLQQLDMYATTETIAASDLKGSRSRHLIQFMKVCVY